MRKVRDIMSAAPACMAPGESVSAAARAMKQHRTGTVLVLTDGRLSGFLTDRDITVRVLAENRDPRTTPIGDICSSELVAGKWHGDLRKLRDDAGGDAGGIASRLTEFPGVGPTGASIFLREAQEVWPGVAPYVDAKVTSGAHRVRLPADRESLAGLLAASGKPARLAAALVRVSLSQRAASEITASVRD